MDFETLARKHWTKYLPATTKVLKEEGKFDQEVKEAAKEIVLQNYIFLPPETTE